MKHPGYSTAKNEYAGRTVTKLSKEAKAKHDQNMKDFAERVKKKLG
jgi:hypothetical protein